MKYIYKNTTNTHQSVLLASKNQDIVGTRTFGPSATLELDYPGLSLYVPNILSCVVIGDENSTVIVPEPVIILPEVTTIVVPEPVVEPEPVVIPEATPVVKVAKAKVPKKVKK